MVGTETQGYEADTRASGFAAAPGASAVLAGSRLVAGERGPGLHVMTASDGTLAAEIDEVDRARAQQYRLLALLLGRAPTCETLARLSEIRGDASPLGLAHIALAQAATAADPAALQREFFDLFVGVGRGELLPFASYYLTGFLYDRPLAGLRHDLEQLGIAAGDELKDPEDHVAILCECMAGLASGEFGEGDEAVQRRFFERHLKPWAARFFADLEMARAAKFYRQVGAVGRMFMEIEAEAFAMDA